MRRVEKHMDSIPGVGIRSQQAATFAWAIIPLIGE
jgi:hypothetical protein